MMALWCWNRIDLEPVTLTQEGTAPPRGLAGFFATDQQLQGIATVWWDS
jgi:hypothetical protein